jgi:sugar O-acyltransferase (sialic acid O-acetyltransferase NeuD family)
MKQQIIIYGAGDFGKLMLYHFTHDSHFEVVAFCLDKQYLTTDIFCSLPVLAFESIENHFPASEYPMFIAIGYSNMRHRSIMFNKAKNKHYQLINFISGKAIVRDDLIIGENNAIFSSSDVEPNVTIGNNNIFWTRSILGHGVKIGDHNYFSGGAGLGGNCIIGDYCFLGNAALMINGITIADETFLVAGAVILRDSELATKYHGNPARRVSQHIETGIIIQ